EALAPIWSNAATAVSVTVISCVAPAATEGRSKVTVVGVTDEGAGLALAYVAANSPGRLKVTVAGPEASSPPSVTCTVSFIGMPGAAVQSVGPIRLVTRSAPGRAGIHITASFSPVASLTAYPAIQAYPSASCQMSRAWDSL